MFFDATDTHGRQRGRRASSSCSPAACRPTTASARRRPLPPLVVLHWGDGHQLPGLRHLGAGQVHAVHRRRHADPRHVHRLAGGDARRPAKQNPTSGALACAPVHTVVAGDTLASIAYASTATRRMWRPLAAFNGIDDPLRLPPGHGAAAARRRRPAGRGCDVAEAQVSNAFTGRRRRHAAAGRPRAAARVRAYVDDSLQPARPVRSCGSATRTARVLAKSGVKIGSKLVVVGDEQRIDARRSR